MKRISSLARILLWPLLMFVPDPKPRTFEELSTVKPREFQLFCCEWLQKRGYRASRGQYANYVPFVGAPGNFLPSDYTIFIFISKKEKGRNAEPDEIGKCKFGKKPATKKDLIIFSESMLKYGFAKGWFFSLNGFDEAALKYIREQELLIRPVSGFELV